MTRKEALTDLLAKVKADEITRLGVEGRAIPALGLSDENLQIAIYCGAAYHGSLKAAKAFHEAVLPEYQAQITLSGEAVVWKLEWAHDWSITPPTGDCPGNPARALFIADIKALIAQEESA